MAHALLQININKHSYAPMMLMYDFVYSFNARVYMCECECMCVWMFVWRRRFGTVYMYMYIDLSPSSTNIIHNWAAAAALSPNILTKNKTQCHSISDLFDFFHSEHLFAHIAMFLPSVSIKLCFSFENFLSAGIAKLESMFGIAAHIRNVVSNP